jgi:hypothetical protein
MRGWAQAGHVLADQGATLAVGGYTSGITMTFGHQGESEKRRVGGGIIGKMGKGDGWEATSNQIREGTMEAAKTGWGGGSR